MLAPCLFLPRYIQVMPIHFGLETILVNMRLCAP